jgi:dTDP-4-amino-4,6-dideoxygalactose transaminase
MNQNYFYKARVALYTILKAFGISAGDRVIIPGYTCIVVPLAVKYLGAVPEYADIDPAAYNVPLSNYLTVYERIASQGNMDKIKAVIIQHTYGQPNEDTQAIVDWARRKGLFVFQDCAHVNGSMIEGTPVENFGDAAFFSMQWSKPYTTGVGGMAVINHPAYVDAVRIAAQSMASPGLRESMTLAIQLLAHKMLVNPRIYWFAITTCQRRNEFDQNAG